MGPSLVDNALLCFTQNFRNSFPIAIIQEAILRNYSNDDLKNAVTLLNKHLQLDIEERRSSKNSKEKMFADIYNTFADENCKLEENGIVFCATNLNDLPFFSFAAKRIRYA